MQLLALFLLASSMNFSQQVFDMESKLLIMKEVKVASFDEVIIRAYSPNTALNKEYLIIVLPLATRPSFIEASVNYLSRKYNVITWESRLILEPDVELTNKETISIESNIKDLDIILDYLNISSAFMIGYCSGAATALHIAASKHNTRIQKMALINGAYFMNKYDCDITQYEQDILGLMPQIAANYNQALYFFTKFFKNSPLFKDYEHEFVEDVYRPYDNVDSFYRFGIGLNNFIVSDLKALAREIKIPTLVASCKLDKQTHYSSSILISSAITYTEMYLNEVGDHYEFCRAKPELMERIFNFFQKP